MDFQQIRSFICVSECDSMTAAAEILNVSQPTLSRRISSLEKELHSELLSRETGNTVLTPSGKRFLPEARSLMSALSRAVNITDILPEQPQTIRIGYTPALMNAFIADALISYKNINPGTTLSLYEGNSSMQLKRMQQSKLDIVCCERTRSAEFSSQKLTRLPIVQVLANANKKFLPKATCASKDHNDTIVIPNKNDFPHEAMLVDRFCRYADITPHIVEVDSILSVLTSVGLGIGMSILPAHLCLARHPGVCFEDLPYVMQESDIVAITRDSKPLKPVQDIIDTLRSYATKRFLTRFWRTDNLANTFAFSSRDRRNMSRRQD